ncbi:multi-sensor signal transduction histidine kinase [Methanosalsum zhilinae DSM 4017]|uniref:histidine kinase n=1 Tax=Methanosalsum zhilinae (strain DSM 4017 / NBRC 107636 / OCM 62 / WeN5) TaxID=679901 RepID=F7XPA9_METZD|nr:GAF domain-containing sensor histidine kinase [Methanosalsum zhilinae]AEH60236.1 multi-sensor signal transduction histidine kinase [Methanosalsum zhilinae DSM 4017]
MKDPSIGEEIEIILNSSPAIIFLWKAREDWPVDFVTDNIIQFGYSKNEFLSGKLNYADIVHPDDVDRVKKELYRYSREGKYKGFTQEYRIITKFGDIRWVDERTLMRRSSKGKITHYQGIIFDVTERKKNEALIRLNEARLETLLELNQMSSYSIHEIIDFALEEAIKLTQSKIGYLAFLNSAENTLTMHSWSQRAMKECEISSKQHLYPLEETGLWGEAVRRREAVITNDYESSPLKRGYPEGHVRIIRHMNVPIFDGQKIVALAGVGNKEEDYDQTDVKQLKLLMEGMWKIIQRKEMEDSLKLFSREFEKTNNELKSINSIKKEFIEDKEYLFSIDCDDNIIDRETLNSINKQQNRTMQIAIRNSEKLKSIVDSMLYMSSEKAGKIKYEKSRVNITDIINDAILNVILRIDEKNINIEQDIPYGIPSIEGDKSKLTDSFSRIIEGSIHFTPPNGNISIDVTDNESCIYVRIKDDGAGIPEPLASTIFVRFYELDDQVFDTYWYEHYEELKSNFYISKNIIEAHDGKIWVESEEGKGTTVHVKLPKEESG